MTIGEILKKKRLEAHMTGKELAKLAGTSASMISHIESGYKVPSLGLADRLTKALGFSMDELIGRKVE